MRVELARVESDFAVARPIPWDENDTLRGHVDQVIDALANAEGVVEVEAEAELERGEVRLAVVIAEAGQADVDRLGREKIAASIRACSGRHFQLLEPAEEEALSQNLPSRSGLLTPLWRLRTLTVGPAD